MVEVQMVIEAFDRGGGTDGDRADRFEVELSGGRGEMVGADEAYSA